MTPETPNLHVSKNLNISKTKQDIEKLKTPLKCPCQKMRLCILNSMIKISIEVTEQNRNRAVCSKVISV